MANRLHNSSPTPWLTAPRCTGNSCASTSPSGGWHAALITAEQPLARGMPGLYLRLATASPDPAVLVATTIVKIIAIGEYAHVENLARRKTLSVCDRDVYHKDALRCKLVKQARYQRHWNREAKLDIDPVCIYLLTMRCCYAQRFAFVRIAQQFMRDKEVCVKSVVRRIQVRV
jgi:hypothetical protein